MNLRAMGTVLAASALFAAGCALHAHTPEIARVDRRDLAAEQRGMADFVFEDFGGLSSEPRSNALPYKVMATALLMDEEQRTGKFATHAGMPRLLRRYGFFVPDSIANWRGLAPPTFEKPMGLEHGTLRGFPVTRIEVVNVGCASCHAGVLYDAQGMPTRTAWLGLPNSSLDLEAFGNDVYRSLQHAIHDRKKLAERIEEEFPMGFGERTTLNRFVLPRAAKRLAELEKTLHRVSPFSNGGPGRTNGTGALKVQMGLMDRTRFDPDIGTISIPNLAARGMRSSLLADGCYGVPGDPRFAELVAQDDTRPHREGLAALVAFFTVGIMGLSPERAEKNIPEMRWVMEYLASTPSPPFPGPVDSALAKQGGELFATRCSGCHGTYAEGPRPYRLVSYPNRLIPQDKMGTDSLRWVAIDSAAIARLNDSVFRKHIDTQRTGGYVAPILSGVWATAPYLHNGSVPTIWHLMHPESRPDRFMVGGHRLDFDRLGIAGDVDSAGVYRDAASYVPWSRPALFDAHEPGLDARGHEAPFRGLSDAQDRALIEYLKCL